MRGLDAGQIIECSPFELLNGLHLRLKSPLGQGTYGMVVEGTYHGVSCGVKIMLSEGLDREVLREVLVGTRMNHPNLISSYGSRVAQLTDEYFDHLEGPRNAAVPRAMGPRMLMPRGLNSGDGFGDPTATMGEVDPLPFFHELLCSLRATVQQTVTIVMMELAERGTLRSAIDRSIFELGPRWPAHITRRAMARTATEIARGMLHLHDLNVIHGDLKPANVMLKFSTSDRRGFTAKVGDFGLATIITHSSTSFVSADAWGSVAYMSPEAFTGQLCRGSDVWSFGVMLWEMCTKQRPYMGMDAVAVIPRVMDGSLVLTWPMDAPLLEDFVALGRRCLSYQPQRRPTFREIEVELVRIESVLRLGGIQQRQQHQQRQQQMRLLQQQGQQQQEQQLQDQLDRASLGVLAVLQPVAEGRQDSEPGAQVQPPGAEQQVAAGRELQQLRVMQQRDQQLNELANAVAALQAAAPPPPPADSWPSRLVVL